MSEIKYKFDIKRKSDGKITHSVMGDKDGDGNNLYVVSDVFTLDVHKAWGDPADYDVVETDISADLNYISKKEKLLNKLVEYRAEILLAILDKVDGDDTRINIILPKYRTIKANNPLPTKP